MVAGLGFPVYPYNPAARTWNQHYDICVVFSDFPGLKPGEVNPSKPTMIGPNHVLSWNMQITRGLGC